MSEAATDPASQFSADATDALARLLVVIADNKYHLGLRYAEWCNSAPALEAAIAAAAMTQDELGHARSLYPLLRNFPNPPDEFDEDEAARDTFLNMELLETPFETWAEFVAANSVPDQLLSTVIEAAAQSNYEPLRQRATKMIQEERFHDLYAAGWATQFKRDAGALEQLQASVNSMWAKTVTWFGPHSGDLNLLHAEGILDADADTLRTRFQQRVQSVLSAAGIKVPA